MKHLSACLNLAALIVFLAHAHVAPAVEARIIAFCGPHSLLEIGTGSPIYAFRFEMNSGPERWAIRVPKEEALNLFRFHCGGAGRGNYTVVVPERPRVERGKDMDYYCPAPCVVGN